MKNLKKNYLILSIMISPFGVFGQHEIDYGTATITPEFCVSLNTISPVSEFYEIDISHLHILDEIDAQNKFGKIENNLLSYEVDLTTQKAYLHLHLDRTSEPKDVLWWSAYLDSLCGL